MIFNILTLGSLSSVFSKRLTPCEKCRTWFWVKEVIFASKTAWMTFFFCGLSLTWIEIASSDDFPWKKYESAVLVFCYQNCSNLLWEKNVLVIKKFKAEGQDFAKILISLEQFVRIVKCQNNFGNRVLFKLVFEGFSYLIN